MLDTEKYFDAGKLVDEVFSNDPQFLLPDNFADKIAEKVSHKFALEQYLREFLIYLGVFIGLASVWVGMAFIWFGADWKEWLNFIVSNASLVVGINLIALFILFADRVLLRYFMFKLKVEVL